MTERPLIVIDLDNTFVDYTTAFKECLTQMGYDDYADAPDPSDYSFACSGWSTDEDTFFPLHRRAVELGLYLRERPYAGALDAAYDLARRYSVLFATSREQDETDSLRWLHAYGLDATSDWNLDLWRDTYPETFELTMSRSCRRCGSGIRLRSTGSWTRKCACSSNGTPTTCPNANAPNNPAWVSHSTLGHRHPRWRNDCYENV